MGKLKVDLNKGLTGVDLQERNDHFGSNFRPPMQPKSYFELLGEQFEDPMLRVLVVCGIVSIVVDMLLAEPEKRAYAWVEGTAILFAVLIVAGVGSFVDWRKEIAFIAVREK